ncbi:MAG TPA: response regulator [Gemmatimonadales bacterium]
MTVLVVDDDQEVRLMCREALRSDGYRVLEADNGQTALHIIEDWGEALDLVVTDLGMPRIDGCEVAEVLSIFRPDLPVLAMTGDPWRADRRLPTLLKPFAFEELIEAARLLRQRAVAMQVRVVEQRERARLARRIAADMQARVTALRNRVDLVSVALELRRLERVGR